VLVSKRVLDIQAESLKMLQAFQLAHSNWDIRWWKNGYMTSQSELGHALPVSEAGWKTWNTVCSCHLRIP